MNSLEQGVYHCKAGDTQLAISAVLVLALTGLPFSIPDGATVVLAYSLRGDGISPRGATARKAATVTDNQAGAVQYAWADGDTAVAGIYDAQWELTFETGDTIKFPNQGFFQIVISETLP